MHSEDKFGLWLGIMNSIQRWSSGDGAYKIHLYDGAPNERKIGDMVDKLCAQLEPMMTTKTLPKRARDRRTSLIKQARVRHRAWKEGKI